MNAEGDVEPTNRYYMHANNTSTTITNATTKLNSIKKKFSNNIEADVEIY